MGRGRLFTATHDHLPESEQGSEIEKGGYEEHYVIQCSRGRMMGRGGGVVLQAVGVLFIVGMDGAAVGAAQRADDHQHQPGQFH